MNTAKIWMVLVLALVLAPAVLASVDYCQSPTDEDGKACCEITGKIYRLINLLTLIAGGVAVVAAIIVGIIYPSAHLSSQAPFPLGTSKMD